MIMDEYTREGVAAFILLRRLGFKEVEIGIYPHDRFGFSIMLVVGRKAFSVMLGPSILPVGVFAGRWKEACQNIELKLWTETRVQAILEGTRVANGAEKICAGLIKEDMLDPNTKLTALLYKLQLVDALGKELISYKLQKKEKPADKGN